MPLGGQSTSSCYTSLLSLSQLLQPKFDYIVNFLLFRQLPSIIAENGGYDSAQLVSELKAKHILGESTMVFLAIFAFIQYFHLSHPGSEHVRGEGGMHAGAGNYRELQREETGVGAGQRGGRDDTQVCEITTLTLFQP